MKKFITLVLALVMALAIALPAMAFTSDTTAPSADSPYELDVYLVEYDNDEFFGITSLPPSDRGYAKNEIVAAVVELYVPKDKDPFDSGYTKLDISGDNVTFNVTDVGTKTTNAPALVGVGTNHADGWAYTLANDILKGKNTFKWLVFAKVTGEDASISAKLIDGNSFGFDTAGTLFITLSGDNYYVTNKNVKANGGFYEIFNDNNDKVELFVDKNHVSTGMTITPKGATASSIIAAQNGVVGVMVGAEFKTTGSTAEAVLDIYDEIVVDAFGMDYLKLGAYVRDSFFTGLVSADTLTATVEIKPWTAYVTVPDNIVVDPPKTGDAASIVGFVMIVLAAAAVVAVKKVRA